MTKLNCKCDFCKISFYRKPSQLSKYNKYFCNRKCRSNYTKALFPKIKTNCTFCEKEIEKTKNQIRSSKAGYSFCNNICKNKYISKENRWSDNPFDYRSRIKRIQETANNACQKCGYNEDVRMLDVHHNDGNHKNNSWDNLRCVCLWCHQRHHRCKVDLTVSPLFNSKGEILFTR